ncbi:maltase-glucoamylase, intestinal-like [Lingula anatina]|uniref:Maltase-glucoamylase, intestinal-like n=1 Tax=Lingula anatina TaxID=7574 RepID=A0A1S3J4F2_LINAN|nr:maltase-glucoamylase, intestinal-like [Lingula anatina]|eukprot:XP_013405317.1 maltase-glucoamylase, intestinal-like [Lingula anatina]
MWGAGLLISPALRQGQVEVEAYFPKARWYDYYSGAELPSSGRNITLPTPIDKINLHVRGGHVIPWQREANTTVISRQNSMGLIVGLDDVGQASGSLFWDDGESFGEFPLARSVGQAIDLVYEHVDSKAYL